MTVFVLDCGAAVSAAQHAELATELPRNKVEVLQLMARVGPAIIGTATLILVFPARRFFDALFSELGRDAHGWFKIKRC
jgi:hypothetical protein